MSDPKPTPDIPQNPDAEEASGPAAPARDAAPRPDNMSPDPAPTGENTQDPPPGPKQP
ncbi:MAG: hypothetical protein ACFB4J_17165 [Elainellaceae cyanobacterium]